jgi:hypothetical protein
MQVNISSCGGAMIEQRAVYGAESTYSNKIRMIRVRFGFGFGFGRAEIRMRIQIVFEQFGSSH